jgi:RimJ/RimL family protein N-acetyltransferase
MRGQGLASRLIRLGAERLQTEHHNAKIHAYVKQENEASLKAFKRASFKRIGVARVSGGEAIHLVYAPEEQAKP